MTPAERDEIFEGLRRRRQAMDARVVPSKAALKPGDHYLVHFPREKTVVYGEILEPIETGHKAGSDEDELDYLREGYAAPELRHYRLAREYSPPHPEGEPGDIHVSYVQARLTPQQFQTAKEEGWPQDKGFVVRLLAWTREATY